MGAISRFLGNSSNHGYVKGLANLCVKSQNDKGQFDYKWDYGKFEESHMASGEAILGLGLAYKVTGDQKYLDAFELAFDYHGPYYTWDDGANMSTAVYSWMSSAFSLGYELTGKEKYKQAAYELSDWMIDHEFGKFFKVGGRYDTEKMKQWPEFAPLIPTIIELRKKEMDNYVIAKLDNATYDLRGLWLTHWGFKLLKSAHNWLTASRKTIIKVEKVLAAAGYKLNIQETNETPIHVKMSPAMREFIWSHGSGSKLTLSKFELKYV